jgi:hypothetical protein
MDPSLAFSRDTQEIYLVGSQINDQFFYERIDAGSYARRTRIGPDHYTTGGLAVVPVPLPEPASALSLPAALAMLLGLARRRSRARAAWSPRGAR